jgi:hypothetical protein
MIESTKRSTIYFDPEIHQALRLKAAHTHSTVSSLVNEAVRLSLREDQEDLAAFEDRANDPLLSYEEFLTDLRTHGKI